MSDKALNTTPEKTASLKRKGRKKVDHLKSTLKALEVSYVAHTDVKPNAYNPNRQSEHDFELLLRSMEDNGFTMPILVNKKTMEIIDGEHRWRAAEHHP